MIYYIFLIWTSNKISKIFVKTFHSIEIKFRPIKVLNRVTIVNALEFINTKLTRLDIDKQATTTVGEAIATKSVSTPQFYEENMQVQHNLLYMYVGKPYIK